jgi:hypothetical protein
MNLKITQDNVRMLHEVPALRSIPCPRCLLAAPAALADARGTCWRFRGKEKQLTRNRRPSLRTTRQSASFRPELANSGLSFGGYLPYKSPHRLGAVANAER